MPPTIPVSLQRVWGYAQRRPSTPNLTNAPLGLAPGATVAVFVAGTTTPVLLYANADGSTPLANPFVADVNGYYDFYCLPRRVDIYFSGTGIATPYTLGDARFVPVDYTVNVMAFGAQGDGVADDTPAILAALASLSSVGGVIFFPPGVYRLTQTIDLTSGFTTIRLMGSGPRATVLDTSVTTTPGILVSNTSTRFTHLSEFSIYQHDRVIPVVARAGNYGISNTAGVGYQLVIDNVEVNYFGAGGIRIEGATGPTHIRDCSIQLNAGYGIELVNSGVEATQDVTISRGNIQFCWGGIFGNQCFSCHISDVDIELSTYAHFPCIYFQGACYGNTITDATCGLQAVPTPAGCVVFGNGSGVVWSGGLTNVRLDAAIDNFLFPSFASHCTILGGSHSQAGSGGTTGYFANFTGGVDVLIVHPNLTATYQAGKDIINDAGSNFVTAIGIKLASLGITDHNSMGVPALHTTDLYVTGRSGFYGTAPIAKPLLATGAGRTVDDVIATLQAFGLVRQT